MGRLYWKFFAAFVLMILIAGIGAGAVLWWHQRQREAVAVDVAIGPRPAILVNAAATTFRHGGLPALRELLTEWDAWGTGRSPVLAVDAEGRELLGRPVPSASLARARALVEAAQRAGPSQRDPRRPPIVRSLSGTDGQRWLLFIAAGTDAAPAGPAPRPRGGPWPLLISALAASVIASALLAWYLAKPIRLLRNGLAAVAQGNLQTRVQAAMGGRRDEIADLGRDFDHMVVRLQAVLEAQNQLLHDVSHELRSPLARLHAAVGLARQSPQRMEASLERIEREAGRLDELVGSVLALSRLQSHHPQEPLERADLNELVRAVADDARFEAQSNGRDVSLRTGPPLRLDVRRELLQRAIENVVRNAVKFTAPATTVEVSVDTQGATAVIEVADRGPGVPEDEREAIFEPFHRGRDAQGLPGFGLGLAIARRAVQAHDGTLRALPREGGGLCLRIELPLRGEAPRH